MGVGCPLALLDTWKYDRVEIEREITPHTRERHIMEHIITSADFPAHGYPTRRDVALGLNMRWIAAAAGDLPMVLHVQNGHSMNALHGTITNWNEVSGTVRVQISSGEETWGHQVRANTIFAAHALPRNRNEILRADVGPRAARMKRDFDAAAYTIWNAAWDKLEELARAHVDGDAARAARVRAEYATICRQLPTLSSMMTMNVQDAQKGRVVKINRSREKWDHQGRNLGHLLRDLPAIV